MVIPYRLALGHRFVLKKGVPPPFPFRFHTLESIHRFGSHKRERSSDRLAQVGIDPRQKNSRADPGFCQGSNTGVSSVR